MPALKRKQALSFLQHTMSAREWNADTADHIVILLEQAGYPLIELADDQQIRVEHDEFYEPDGDYDLEEELRGLRSGELGAYTVLLEKECQCGNYTVQGSLSGVIVSGGQEGAYGTIEGMGDAYLRSIACELISEAGL